MAAATALTSAGPILSLLYEEDNDLRGDALTMMNDVVDLFWFELAPAVNTIESLAYDSTFSHNKLAASVASKIYHHMSEPREAVRLALDAVDTFDVSSTDTYSQAIVSTCIDDYCASQRAAFQAASEAEAGTEEASALEEALTQGLATSHSASSSSSATAAAPAPVDPRVATIVERVIAACIADGKHKAALGIALESYRTDLIEKILVAAPAPAPLMRHVFTLATTTISFKPYRVAVIALLARLYSTAPANDSVNVCEGAGEAAASSETPLGVVSDILAYCQCLFLLDNSDKIAEVLSTLTASPSARDNLIALQVSFELVENQHLAFMTRVSSRVTTPADASDAVKARVARLQDVLSGQATASLNLKFLLHATKTNTAQLDGYVQRAEARNHIVHSAIVTAHAFLTAGTACDGFLRDNTSWLRQATSWGKFSAAGCIGLTHRGQADKAKEILASFLPNPDAPAPAPAAAPARREDEGPPQSSFQEGGAFYALGLMSCGVSAKHVPYLLEALTKEGADEVQVHGALLGLGLAAIATKDDSIYAEIHQANLVSESAVIGEAAGYAIGLVFLGSGAPHVIQELLSLLTENPHEKTIRGAAMALALISYAREDAADLLIDYMLADKDPVVRYGGAWAAALAYAGTSATSAIKRLLRAAVTDTADDVRRAAVTGLGFVMLNNPEQLPALVSNLAGSYNAFVRYGAALALGIACAGRGLAVPEAHTLLEPLLTDRTDFVRQGAFIAMGMVMQGVTETPATKDKITSFRAQINEATHRRADTAARLGVYYGAGILDAGGCNATMALMTAGGQKRMVAIAGAALFCQYWFWYPLSNMLGLSFAPSAAIGVTGDLRIPTDWKLVSTKPPGWFGYIEAQQAKKEEEAAKKVVNVLSIAKKKKKRVDGTALSRSGSILSRAASAVAQPSTADAAAAAKPTAGAEEGSSDGKTKEGRIAAVATAATAMADDEEEKDDSKEAAEAEKKPVEEKVAILSNPTRIVPAQARFIVHPPKQRFTAVTKRVSGVIVLADATPDAPIAEYAPAAVPAPAAPAAEAGKEAKGEAEKGVGKVEEGDEGAEKAKEEAAEKTEAAKGDKAMKDDDDEDEPGVPKSFNMSL